MIIAYDIESRPNTTQVHVEVVAQEDDTVFEGITI